MFWEMIARSRIYTAFRGFEDDDEAPTRISADANGQAEVDVSQIAARLAIGQRPGATSECPQLLYKLMRACWVHEMDERLTASELLSIITTMRQREARGIFEELAVEPQSEITYDEFLGQLNLDHRKGDLAEYLSNPGSELQELKQMCDDELYDDILSDDDLGFDHETRTKFAEAVCALRESPKPPPLEGTLVATPKDQLFEVLDIKVGTDTAEAQRDRAIVERDQAFAKLAEKDEELAEKDRAIVERDQAFAKLAEKDEELAEKDEELEQLRAQLERLEGVSPP
eukprot:COSAG06_NODE_326_length_17450_cov_287.265921_10_plen_285_part_00